MNSDMWKIYLMLSPFYIVFIWFGILKPGIAKRKFKAEKRFYENMTYNFLDKDATIVDVKTEKYQFYKHDKGFKTIVTFSDGFKYWTTEANYNMHVTYTSISVGRIEKLEIINHAMEAHKKAYEKLYGVTVDESVLRKEVPCLLYCKNCNCVYSGTSGRKDGLEACPDCRRRLLRTTFPVEKWRILTDDDKKKVLAGFSLGYGLEISNVVDKVMK